MAGRALVLGGGGVTGVAWELGILAGLAEAGVDLTGADVVIGTSAGSVVGAQITSGKSVADLYAAQLGGRGSEVAARLPGGVLVRIALMSLSSRDSSAARARVGRMALAASTPAESQRRTVIESRLPALTWPQRRLLVTAVDAESGEFVVFGQDSGVSLVDAVGASCAVPGVWPPVTIGGRRYIDGGIRSMANADLAAGHERIAILSPISVRLGRLSRQVDQLRQTARVLLVTPDRAARRAIGRNVLDPARRAPAAQAGHRQAADVAAAAAALWR